MPASPPDRVAQARMQGLMTEIARRHDLTAVMLVDDQFDGFVERSSCFEAATRCELRTDCQVRIL
jgi:hypothetical protein